MMLLLHKIESKLDVGEIANLGICLKVVVIFDDGLKFIISPECPYFQIYLSHESQEFKQLQTAHEKKLAQSFIQAWTFLLFLFLFFGLI